MFEESKQESDSENAQVLGRRDFLKGSLAVGAVGALGALAACTPKTADDAAAPATNTSAPEAPKDIVTHQNVKDIKWIFEIPPDPIPEESITETIEADIIVVGAGTAGLAVANSAAENGAKVVLISASTIPIYRGGSNHAMDSKAMKRIATEFPPPDTGKYLRREIATASYNIDQDKWWLFAKHSEEAMDWLIDKMEAAGYLTILEDGFIDPGEGDQNMYVGSHSWVTSLDESSGMGQEYVVNVLADTAQASGVEIRYSTIAEQLVRENNNTGRVSAVIAKNAEGAYQKYLGTKAVVLATGDFSADYDMMAKYCPMALPTIVVEPDAPVNYDVTFSMGGLYKGDGQKMGLWVGAAWQKTVPNPPMLMGGAGPASRSYGGNSGLVINKHGKRYSQEDSGGAYPALAQLHQPETSSFSIWDSNYAEAAAPWSAFGGILGVSTPIPPADIVAGWEQNVSAGAMVKANTIEEVISLLGLPADTIDTVNRYNELCEKGVDEDFFKRKELLVPITNPPFYGQASTVPTLLTVMGGLRTNLNMQVCDESDTPIEGLYNVGTMVGDYYANIYNFMIQGNNLGANCVTFGYLTGKNIATGTISS